MAVNVEKLKALEKTKDFFVGIDSDGCAFDTMEVKHKFCFVVAVLQAFSLAALARILRDVWDFVNLNGQSRGCNRWLALRATFRYLRSLSPYRRFDAFLAAHLEIIEQFIEAAEARPEIQLSNDGLLRLAGERLGGPARLILDAIVADPVGVAYSRLGRDIVAAGTSPDECLLRLALWTHLVNGLVAQRVHDVPPFPHVRESLEKLQPRADIMVVSATPNEALHREWREHDIARYTAMICGQELGKKSEHLKYGAGGKYPPENILMIGDAPGDLKAARSVNACFYPINPGEEVASWKRFHEEAAEMFFGGRYRGSYEDGLIEEFTARLPARPPWEA
ncbi:MAG: HAD hydrolase-like protein [Planctomycetes bacterium]|nr:HAD hydrolase-like protein [Planctomycetota bacterium]